jgi:ribosome-binding factor A
MPVLKFFRDDTLDHVFKMEELFKRIGEENKTVEGSADTITNT